MDTINDKKKIDNMLDHIEKIRFSDSKAAMDIALNALELSKEINYPQAESILLLKIGGIYVNIGEYAKATDYISVSIPLLELYNLQYHICTAYLTLGAIFYQISGYEAAFDYFSKSADIAKRFQFTDMLSITYNNIGAVCRKLLDYEKALLYYQKSYEEDKKTGFSSCKGVYYENTAEIYYLTGDYDKALEHATIAIEKMKSIKYDNALCEVYETLALVYWKLNKYEEAGSYFSKALDIAENKMVYSCKISVLINYHQFLTEQGQTDPAVKALTEAYTLAKTNNLHEKSIIICGLFSEMYDKCNNMEASLNYHKLYVYHNQQLQKDRLNQITEGIKLRIKTEEIRQQSEFDPLTGIPNRRRFVQFINSEWELSKLQNKPLSIIMLDIDFFKEFNDIYGHPEGDKCLISITACLAGLLKNNYLLARYGGDELITVLPNTSLAEAAEFAEAMRQAVLNEKICHSRSTVSDYVTITLGVASAVPSDNLKPDDFIKQADDALYDAKRRGRNKVCRKAYNHDK
ncbi:MAG: diguanylate cyclase [Clostridiaceae bacterium]